MICEIFKSKIENVPREISGDLSGEVSRNLCGVVSGEVSWGPL